jgi:hypothetical protein
METIIPATCTNLRVSEDSLPLKALEKLEPSQIRLINPEYHTTSINTVGGGRPNCSSPLRPSTAFFLLGLDQLNLILGTCSIPEATIRILMEKIGVESSSVEKILPVDATRAVLVQMLTPFHKDGAMNKIRGFLRSQGMRETGVQDCFQMDSPRVDEDQNNKVSWLQC